MACRLFARCASLLCEVSVLRKSGAACAMPVSKPHNNEENSVRGSMAYLVRSSWISQLPPDFTISKVLLPEVFMWLAR